jgi:hypothetical protein
MYSASRSGLTPPLASANATCAAAGQLGAFLLLNAVILSDFRDKYYLKIYHTSPSPETLNHCRTRDPPPFCLPLVTAA